MHPKPSNPLLLPLLLTHLAAAASLYPPTSPVLSITSSTYDPLIAHSNHTSILEFYAPWCGHCQNLKPAYEKAAASLAGLATVAAINCDDDANKPFCGSMGVQGFPTLKIVKPRKGKGKRGAMEDYQGQRSAKAIVEAVKERMPNHVARVKDEAALGKWLGEGTASAKAKAIVFGEKPLVPAVAKALAVDFLGGIEFAYVRSSERGVVGRYGVDKFPAVLLLPEGEGTKEPIRYEGEMKKAPLVQFFSQVMPPHPDAAAASDKKSKEPKKASRSTSKKAKNKDKPTAASETFEPVGDPPTQSPDPNVATNVPPPVQVPIQKPPEITALDSASALQKACLHPKATTCILAIIPPGEAEETSPVLVNLGLVVQKHVKHGAKMFPVYSVPDSNPEGRVLVEKLGVEGVVEKEPVLLAVNAKRGWWTSHSVAGDSKGEVGVEDWIDSIRLGEMKKRKLPDGVVGEVQADAAAEEKGEQEAKEAVEEEQEKPAASGETGKATETSSPVVMHSEL